MVPLILKELFVPGTVIFFLLVASVAAILLYRRKNQGRTGRRVLTAVVVFYWLLSTPATAILLVRALSPDYPPVMTSGDARHASAIVVLGGGMEIYRSRGAELPTGSREHSLRALEAARVYRLLDRPWVIVSGSLGSTSTSEAVQMRRSLTLLGVSADRILEEGKSRNTHDHTLYIPGLLTERRVTQFVLVTSRQHMARALRAFRAAGLDPVPSSPEFFIPRDGRFANVIPSETALEASSAMLYDIVAMLYYRARGWL